MGCDPKIERERKWRGHLAAWKTGGLSQAAYCRQHGLAQHDFSWWKRTIVQRDKRAISSAPAFVPVRLTAVPAPCYPFELEVHGGRVLRFDARADPATLRALLAALEQERAGC